MLDQINLKDEDRPTQIENINYADTLFYLHARANAKPAIKDRDDPLLKKQMEILTEIVDSELKYLEDLKLIQIGFIDPVHQSGCLTEEEMKDVFYNIRELISVHEVVWSEISVSHGTFKQKLLNLIDSFMSAVLYVLSLGSKVQLLSRLLRQPIPTKSCLKSQKSRKC